MGRKSVKSRNEMSKLCRKALTCILTFSFVVFAVVFAHGQSLTPRAAVTTTYVTQQNSQSMSSVADLAASAPTPVSKLKGQRRSLLETSAR